MSFIKKLFGGLIIPLLLIAGPQHGSAQPQASQQRTIKVSYEYAHNSLPLFIAIEQGYFSNKNIRVELQEITSNTRFDVSSSSWDLSIGYPIKNLPNNKGLFDYIRLCHAQYMTTNGDMIHGLVVRSDLGIKTVDDLKGKVLAEPGIFPGMEEMFTAKGISWSGKGASNVTILLNTGGDYLGQGSGSYTWGEEAMRLVEEKKDKFMILDKNLAAQYICDPYYLNVSIVRASLFMSDERLIWDTLQALDEAVVFIKSNPERARKAIPKTFTGYTETAAQKLPLPAWHLSSEKPNFENLRKVRWRNLSELEQFYIVRERK